MTWTIPRTTPRAPSGIGASNRATLVPSDGITPICLSARNSANCLPSNVSAHAVAYPCCASATRRTRSKSKSRCVPTAGCFVAGATSGPAPATDRTPAPPRPLPSSFPKDATASRCGPKSSWTSISASFPHICRPISPNFRPVGESADRRRASGGGVSHAGWRTPDAEEGWLVLGRAIPPRPGLTPAQPRDPYVESFPAVKQTRCPGRPTHITLAAPHGRPLTKGRCAAGRAPRKHLISCDNHVVLVVNFGSSPRSG